jgi:hypothetical protein
VTGFTDGLFLPRSWAGRLLDCEVISSPGWDRLSDHNPVMARFGRRRVANQVRSVSGGKSGRSIADEPAQRELPWTNHPKCRLPTSLTE